MPRTTTLMDLADTRDPFDADDADALKVPRHLLSVCGRSTLEGRAHDAPDVVARSPDQRHISTGLVERQDVTMRISMGRFTRLYNVFRRKAEKRRCISGRATLKF
jgi:hypothetical protein